MILVLTGTHHQPFDRLVAAAEGLAQRGEEVVIQRGVSRVPAPHATVQDWFTPEALDALADRAEVVISHGGPGSLFLAWERGRLPILVPRRAALGEHVDDHQVRFADEVGDRVVRCDDVTRLSEALNAARDVLGTDTHLDAGRGEAFRDGLDELVRGIVHRNRQRTGLRGRLRSFFFRLGTPAR